MTVQFGVLTKQLDAACGPSAAGRVTLSDLAPGSSVLGAPAASLKLVLDGEEIYSVDGRSVRVAPGQFLFLDAGAECVGTNRRQTLGMCVALPAAEGAVFDEGAKGWDPVLGRAMVFSASTTSAGRGLFAYASKIARNPDLGPELAPEIVATMARAVAEPLGESRAAISALKAARSSTRRELFQRLERVRGFLHDNEERPITLGELAKVAGLSQFHLARYFKMAFGQSPVAYHRQLRLAYAARMMRDTDHPLAEVADRIGYSDPVALSHAFRRQYGKAPRRWSAAAGG